MKRIIVMILMLGISLHTFAKEQKIKCDSHRTADSNQKYVEIYLLDSENKTLRYTDDAGTVKNVSGGYVNDESFGYNTSLATVRVDRGTGEYRYINNYDGMPFAIGTCAPFIQAF